MSTFEQVVDVLERGVAESKNWFFKHVETAHHCLFLNASLWTTAAFELGLLFWRHGEIDKGAEWFASSVQAYRLCAEQYPHYQSMPEVKEAFDEGSSIYERHARIAGYLVDTPIGKVRPDLPYGDEIKGYDPWFESVLTDACVDGKPINADAFEESKKLFLQRRGSRTKMEEWEFFRDVLVGKWASRDIEDMFRHHAGMYLKRARRKGLGDLALGEGKFNDLVVDFQFAAVLKRIGWRGRYLHGWPEDGHVVMSGDPVTTVRSPFDYVDEIGTGARPGRQKPMTASVSLDDDIKLFEDAIGAKQVAVDVKLTEIEAAGALKALRELGVEGDNALCSICTRWSLSRLPAGDEEVRPLSSAEALRECSEYFQLHHGMARDLILLSELTELSDWEAPEGSVIVYSRADRRVYLADVADLGDLQKIREGAQEGLSTWRNFAAFAVWYVGEAR
ncbi:MAG: hypothetical protein R3C52_06885 [Hyphomonadaceae bacterium]